MDTIKRFSRAPLVWLALVPVAVGLAIVLRFTVKAQDDSTPPGWTSVDIGGAAAGVSQADGTGGFSLRSAGADIWGQADSFHFLYQPLGTNGQIVARILGIAGTNGYVKAGVMIRETLDAGSRNAMMLLTQSNGTDFQWRSANGQRTIGATNAANAAAPYWVKIVRSADWLGGFGSSDGTNWTLVDWQTIGGMASQVYVGLAVTSQNTEGSPSTAWFDQVSVSEADLSQVGLPVIGRGDGLSGRYYDNRHLFGASVTNRVDKQLDFDFGVLTQQGAATGVAPANQCVAVLGIARSTEFGVRWIGEVQAQFTEPYVFYAKSDDGVRVWLNERLIIDDWVSHPARESSAVVNLVAGQRYLLRVEYFQNYGAACMTLAWSSHSTSKRLIPQSQLYSQPTDTDGNGLPDLWEEHYFGHIGVDPGAKANSDGLSNLQKWQLHRDPTNSPAGCMPVPWGHGDITWRGEDSGDAGYSKGVFAVTSFGGDIFDQRDSCHYVYQQLLGTNWALAARVVSLTGTNGYAKAALMMRQTLEGRSRDAAVCLTASNGLRFLARGQWSGSTEHMIVDTNSPSAPYWLKLIRNGDWIGGYAAADGTNWTLIGWQMLTGLPSEVYVGLAVSAHNSDDGGGPATAQFDQVSLGPANMAEVLAPVVGNGDGLLGSYRNDSLLYLPGLTNRVDGQVNFFWVHALPMSLLNPNSYGVCWSGEVQAQFTEPYTFSVFCRSEDWVRIWINDQLVLNGWREWHPDATLIGTPVSLVAGQHYLIRVEMFNNLGHGVIQLRWSSPSTSMRQVPQSQLYSHPTDSDGKGLPDIWQRIYFGHLGTDPNADPDRDGLSNLQEYRYHTNPLKADTDGDGMPDAWEIAHGLDPQFNDAGLDYDNSGLSNLQKYLIGLDPFNADVDGDGVPDYLEAEYLGINPAAANHKNVATVVASVSGAQATNLLGRWQVDGAEIYALDRRGGLDFILPVGNADKYVLNIIGTQNQPNPWETSFRLLLGMDGQTLGHYSLHGGYGTNGTVALALPYLQAGSHTLRVFWDGVASFSSLRIKQVNLLGIAGATNQNGIKSWAAQMISDESHLDNTNGVIGSYTSPVCLEGRDPYPTMMRMTNGQSNALSPVATTDNRWYVNVPFTGATQTVFQAAYQNGALSQTRTLQWRQFNLLTTTNSTITIRKGDSLLFNALPVRAANGSLQITIGTDTLTGTTSKPISYRFTAAGVYTVTGTYTPSSGSAQSGSIRVKVAHQDQPNVQPDAWSGMERNWTLSSLAPEALLQADSRLTCFIEGTNSDGAVRLTLGADANEPRSILARVGSNGPVLDSTQVQCFDLWSGNQVYTHVLEVYPDGSQLVEMWMVWSPVLPDVTFKMSTIASGILFEDGTTTRTLTATDFDALGQCAVRFIRPASATTSVCNQIKAYQGQHLIGNRH